MAHYVGLDLSMEDSRFCVVDETGKIVFEGHCASKPFEIQKALKRFAPKRVVLETGRMAPGLVHGLRGLDVPVVCIESRQAHQSLQALKANKTDRGDAHGLAQLARTGFYKEVHVKSLSAHGVKSMIAARAHLIRTRAKVENQLRGLAACFGLQLGKGAGRDFARRTYEATRARPGLTQAVDALLEVHASLVSAIVSLDREMRRSAREREVCARIMAIPGVGVQTALAVTAALDCPDRFKRSRDVGPYLGLVPRRHQSGEIDYSGRITKRGDGTARALLYEAANSILTRFKGSMKLKSWALRIAERSGLKKARVALARRLAVIMHAMMMDGTEFAMS
ncbi:IS110 family transposase [uncultured Roseibium sp.]|uniref:IS110 family transposase n=1 Tax=uncultured Roseibium sp. TaxID=1936171 RepID=UPI0026069282|nr:IS110 family transposase [uncultured Roseibium sp.]